MNRYCWTAAAAVFLMLSTPVLAQESSIALQDLTVVEEGEALPTVAGVDALKAEADAAVAANDCAEAAPLLNTLAKQANALGNIIRQGVEPFYDASRDEQEDYRGARSKSEFDTLVSAEAESNRRLRQRDEAKVREARCLIELGDRERAINTLYSTLDLIGIRQDALWEEARGLLWGLVGYNPNSTTSAPATVQPSARP
jgi:hypothetical protein